MTFLGEVNPELQADVGGTIGVLAGHLGVHDAFAGGHELEVARVEGAAVAGEVFVVHAAGEEVIVSWPRWGWSGKPAPGETEKWSSMRKGLRERREGVPMERRTVAPAPSDCCFARRVLRMRRGRVMRDIVASWAGVMTVVVVVGGGEDMSDEGVAEVRFK
ncbi:LOW QUALITY PROTEIN: hypothetical protein QC763_0053680 [Podospora pseudopauciseta]|uniref:Uncharacterized protein n=1 Tax=Podospora pseudopauciseta TaxID=2093780 RepID=A0ABR0HGL8_9PEZI|nr:LOW QUALITY PROTEIN: hypothetical protein QC763_0053680 [Podospora pseudopauciseta]